MKGFLHLLRVLYNATHGYMFFFLIGLAMVAFQQGIVFAVGASSLYEVEHPEAMQGYGIAEIMLAKTTVYWSLAMCSYLLVLLGITQGLGIDLHAPLWQLLLLAGIFILAAIGFCFFFSSFFPAELPFVRAAILYPVPCFIFSGYTWPMFAELYHVPGETRRPDPAVFPHRRVSVPPQSE